MNKRLLFAFTAGALAVAQYRFNFVKPLVERAPACLTLSDRAFCTNSQFEVEVMNVISMFEDPSSLPSLLVFKLPSPSVARVKGIYSKNSLMITAEASRAEEESTLLHELLHAYFFNSMPQAEKMEFHNQVLKILNMFTLETPTALSGLIEDSVFMKKLRLNLNKAGFSKDVSKAILNVILFAGLYGRRCIHGQLDNNPTLLDSSEIFSFMAEEGIHPAFVRFYPFKEDVLKERTVDGVRREDILLLDKVNRDLLSRIVWDTIEQ